MRDTLGMINRMQTDGVIDEYAIGGAVGATFYLEPSATEDVDIFVMLPTAPGSSLLSLSPIYDYLRARGCVAQGERIVIGDWPVQFLPRRVSTTLRQVFAKFSEFFMCWGFPLKNFAPGSPRSDDLQLGRPTVSPLLSFFKRISHSQS